MHMETSNYLAWHAEVCRPSSKQASKKVYSNKRKTHAIHLFIILREQHMHAIKKKRR